MTIRAVRPDDLPSVAAIYEHYALTTVITFDEAGLDPAAWEAKAGTGWPFLVAEVGGVVAGFGYAGPYRPKPAYRHTVEDSLYISPEHTGRGLGRALLRELIVRSREAGARQMIAVIADAQPASVGLHVAEGFTEAGRLRDVGFKLGRWVDTALYQRTLA
ncbi:GNAT family N-acetyltransferase [Herbidospora sp. NEAU-GS84]|uniref:GNAT family N-acetyltransferase n=1 Tax=Herbidospora solisilvae TaxID=2696284 RepID=A0A7C9JCH6_9ACTN|nr:GNAT family N-acetyltransferase [Herbidospora solisilvae]NAS27048.1 GNAT family N-acetyltransferase [Herbidospora solisilvae]